MAEFAPPIVYDLNFMGRIPDGKGGAKNKTLSHQVAERRHWYGAGGVAEECWCAIRQSAPRLTTTKVKRADLGTRIPFCIRSN